MWSNHGYQVVILISDTNPAHHRQISRRSTDFGILSDRIATAKHIRTGHRFEYETFLVHVGKIKTQTLG